MEILKNVLMSLSQNTKDGFLWTRQRLESIIPSYYDDTNEEDLLMQQYYDALNKLKLAEQNFQFAELDYVEGSIIDLKSKEILLNTIIKELKELKNTER